MASLAQAHNQRCSSAVDLVQPERGVISNAQTASAVAFAYLVPIYGEAQIRRELPLRATLRDEVWTVEGVLPPRSIGGTAFIALCQRNGTVLRIIHSK
ncbi:NTF2 fold immunity protein [Rhizorhabdus argentea]|uniref:NTF2 fold immunity protein n=1 Tax=Rhizorhabdus argentea TaxID=1387174 RepID=UPI003BF47F3D